MTAPDQWAVSASHFWAGVNPLCLPKKLLISDVPHDGDSVSLGPRVTMFTRAPTCNGRSFEPLRLWDWSP